MLICNYISSFIVKKVKITIFAANPASNCTDLQRDLHLTFSTAKVPGRLLEKQMTELLIRQALRKYEVKNQNRYRFSFFKKTSSALSLDLVLWTRLRTVVTRRLSQLFYQRASRSHVLFSRRIRLRMILLVVAHQELHRLIVFWNFID